MPIKSKGKGKGGMRRDTCKRQGVGVRSRVSACVCAPG